MIRRIAAALLVPAILAGAAWADIDRPALYKHLMKTFNTPPGVEFELGELKPSPIPGFKMGTLKSTFRGSEQSHTLLVSDDGKTYILSDVYKLKDSPMKGLVEPETATDDVPSVHITKDLKYFFIGDAHDLTVDPDAANLAKIKLSKDVMSRGGNEKAPVVLVEYSDLECPYCRNAHLALEEKLEATYGKKVRWVFKNFPLTSIHPWAYSAAIGVSCAKQQKNSAAWKMEQAIFQDQPNLNPANLKDKLLDEAKKTGLKTSAFEACYDKQQTSGAVDADMKEGMALKVNSTPTLVVNGRVMAGFRDFDSLKSVIDEALKDKGQL